MKTLKESILNSTFTGSVKICKDYLETEGTWSQEGAYRLHEEDFTVTNGKIIINRLEKHAIFFVNDTMPEGIKFEFNLDLNPASYPCEIQVVGDKNYKRFLNQVIVNPLHKTGLVVRFLNIKEKIDASKLDITRADLVRFENCSVVDFTNGIKTESDLSASRCRFILPKEFKNIKDIMLFY